MRKAKKLFIVFVFMLLLIGCVLYLLRGKLLQYGLELAIRKVEKEYHSKLYISQSGFTGWKSIELKGLTLIPMERDTLLRVESIFADIHILPLFKKRISFSELNIVHAKLTPIKKGGIDNYMILFESDSMNMNTIGDTDYAALCNGLIEKAFANIPDRIKFTDLKLKFQQDNYLLNASIPELIFIDQKINASIRITSEEDSELWMAEGKIDKSKNILSGKLYAQHNSLRIPFLEKRWKLKLQFDTIRFRLDKKDYDGEILKLKGVGAINELVMNHPRLDSNDIVFHQGKFDYSLLIGKKFFKIQAPSAITLNKVKLNLSASYKKEVSKQYSFDIESDEVSSQDFFESLPTGLFSTFEGIKTSGTLKFTSSFLLDMDKIDSVKFHSELKKNNFRILTYGLTDFKKMNGNFLYTVYEKDKPVRSFIVGPENPGYTSLDQISPILKSAVLNSEDGSFFYHKGFREDAFCKAIAENIRAGKFKRGGSTISMQLVKNVFLSRKKTIARKMEETLIVWLIENNRLTSKERMYEVYLNIIEWGPAVYGAREAAHFYFAKEPHELTMEEGIFMASIIPSPKGFKYSFDAQGNLKDFLNPYYKKLGGLLQKKGLISDIKYDSLKARVVLTGPARKYIISDTLQKNQDEEQDFLF